MIMLILCVFFQAEDGIRDGDVTGVQTCALPILAPSPYSSCLMEEAIGKCTAIGKVTTLKTMKFSRHSQWFRSEERRVGKECRYRWCAYHHKTNSMVLAAEGRKASDQHADGYDDS